MTPGGFFTHRGIGKCAVNASNDEEEKSWVEYVGTFWFWFLDGLMDENQ